MIYMEGQQEVSDQVLDVINGWSFTLCTFYGCLGQIFSKASLVYSFT